MSFLSAILYMVFPYRLEIYFNRFSMGEISAFMFIPIVFQGLYNLIHNEGNKHYYITIGAVGLILSHTITTTYTAVFCIIYILFHLKDFFKKDILTVDVRIEALGRRLVKSVVDRIKDPDLDNTFVTLATYPLLG